MTDLRPKPLTAAIGWISLPGIVVQQTALWRHASDPWVAATIALTIAIFVLSVLRHFVEPTA